MRIAVAALIGLLAALGMMTIFQDQLLFPTDAVPPAGPLPPDAEMLALRSSTGEELHGVYFPRAAGSPGPATLVLGFGGNAWNAQHVAEYLHDIFPQAHVAAFHYRGYRPSGGRPSAEALLEDAPLVLEAAAKRAGAGQVIAVGFSIGSGVAASLSGQPLVEGLILVTPFDSLRAVAADLYPFFPVGAFFRHEIDAAAFLEGKDVPVALIAAEKDNIIPPARTAAFRKRIGNLRFDETLGGAGHNDIYELASFRQAMRNAFSAVAAK